MSNISDILSTITKIFSNLRSPAPVIPPPTLLLSSPLRPGLSPALIASRIIARQSEAGVPSGVLPSGNDNLAELMEVIRVEEIINAILTDARIDIAIAPGVPLTATGGNAGGPVQSVGITTGIASGSGIIR